MSWQEELRKLDEELAAGQISADDYRVRRDQVLSSAVSPGAEALQGQPKPAESTQFVPRPSAAQPPPPLPQPPGPQAEDVDRTQIVPGQDADRTQAVGGWHTARPGDDAERTQIVPGVPPQTVVGGMPRPAPPPGQFPPTPGYGWQQQDQVSPPWAGTDFPPLAPAGSPDWIRQGPEVFDDGRRSRSGRILAIVAVVVVLAGLGVGGYFLLRPKGNDNQGQPGQPAANTATSQPTSRSTSKPPTTSNTPPKPITQPPGSTLVDATFTLQRLGEVKILSAEDFDILSRNKIVEAQVAVTKEGDLTRGTWAFKAADRASAEQIFKEIDQLYRQVNFQPAPGISKEHVSALYFKPPNPGPNAPTVFRAHYIAGSTVVRVEAYGTDATLASAEFGTLLDAQLAQLPPN